MTQRGGGGFVPTRINGRRNILQAVGNEHSKAVGDG